MIAILTAAVPRPAAALSHPPHHPAARGRHARCTSFCSRVRPWSSAPSAVVFALAVANRIGAALDLGGTVVVLALTVMLSMKLIGFLMLTVRHEAMSQILGLLVLENGMFLGAQILVPGMPLLIEIVILFDLLIVVACFGVLVHYLDGACRDAPAPSSSSGWWADDGRACPCDASLAPAAGDRAASC